MKKAIGFLVMILVLLGCANAEFDITVNLKKNEIPVSLSEICPVIPDFPWLEWEDDHMILSNLAAWGVDSEYLTAYQQTKEFDYYVYVPTGEQFDDRIVIYGEPDIMKDYCSVTFTLNQGKLNGSIYFGDEISQEKMVMRISENQKNGFSMTLFSYGSIYFDYGDISTLYQNGLLENGWYYLTNGKTRVTYGIAYAGQKDDERVYTLAYLSVKKSAGKNDWEEYTKSQWNPCTGWSEPKDKTVAKINVESFPFSLKSPDIPCRILPGIRSAPAAVADDLSYIAPIAQQRKAYYSLQEIGLPALPEYTVEETDEGRLFHMTGLTRFGAEEDTADLHLISEDCSEYNVNPHPNPDIESVRIYMYETYEDYFIPCVDIWLQDGSSLCYYPGRWGDEVDVTVDIPGEEWISFYFRQDGYLTEYHMSSEGHYYTFKPRAQIDASMVAEKLEPEVVLYNYSYENDCWRGDDGRLKYIGEDEAKKDMPLPDEAYQYLPPQLKFSLGD